MDKKCDLRSCPHLDMSCDKHNTFATSKRLSRRHTVSIFHTSQSGVLRAISGATIIAHAKVLPVFEKGSLACNVININWFV